MTLVAALCIVNCVEQLAFLFAQAAGLLCTVACRLLTSSSSIVRICQHMHVAFAKWGLSDSFGLLQVVLK